MKLRNWFWFVVLLFIAGLALYFTNPNRGAHCNSIKSQVTKERPIMGGFIARKLCNLSTYNDFYLFSTTEYRGETVSYGAFTKVFVVNTDINLAGEWP